VAWFAARDARVRLLRQPNRKLPAALNAGFQASRGTFLTWTSDDNQYEPDAIALMAAALEYETEIGLVYCDYTDRNDSGEMRRVCLPEPDILPQQNCVGACFLYRRTVYEAIGDYDTQLFLAEDYDYWLRVSKRFLLRHLTGVCPYRYASHADSLTAKRLGDVRLAAVRARLKNTSSRRQRLWIYLATRGVAAEAMLGLGRRVDATACALLYTLCRPWKPYGWSLLGRCLRVRG
jgi:GT2 family glycosyltransferase